MMMRHSSVVSEWLRAGSVHSEWAAAASVQRGMPQEPAALRHLHSYPQNLTFDQMA